MKALNHAWIRLNFSQQNIPDFKEKQPTRSLVATLPVRRVSETKTFQARGEENFFL
jgi:hypothetical protein